MGATARGVFLDRDGVINETDVVDGIPRAPNHLGALKILPGVAETLENLRRMGFRLIVVTNQPDVRHGVIPQRVVEEMHRHLLEELAIDAIKVCFHIDDDGCSCRKPKPGMLTEAAAEWNLDLASSYMIGDRWRDVGAGRAAGCRIVWIDRGYSEHAPEGADRVASSLAEAGRIIRVEASR